MTIERYPDAPQPSGTRTATRPGPCPEAVDDPRRLVAALRPLGEAGELSRHAARCPDCFARIRELFLTMAPDDGDPVHRIVDGLNHALYRLAKAILHAARDEATAEFFFDHAPPAVADAAAEALDRIHALEEYAEGARPSETRAVKELVEEAALATRTDALLAEAILKRSVSIGGRYGLDAANLLGFLRYRKGDLDGAELLFRTVIERRAFDAYERETQAHAMNNLTGVHVCRGHLKSAILWCERSLMVKERLGLDARTNYLNLLFFWLENGTGWGVERARNYLRNLLLLDGGRDSLEHTLNQPAYGAGAAAFRRSGLAAEFPELRLPPAEPAAPEASTA